MPAARRLVLAVLGLFSLAFFATGCVPMPNAEASFRRTLTVAADAPLVADTAAGSVIVVRGAEGKIVLSGRVLAWNPDQQEAQALADMLADEPPVAADDDGVRLGEPDEANVYIDWVVEAPAGTALTLRTASGDVCVRGLDGRVDASTASGRVDVQDAGGAVIVRTSSGDVKVTGAASADVATASGDVVAKDVEGELEVATSSGDVEAADIGGGIDLGTASGDVKIRSALGAGRTWRVGAVSGGLELTLPGDSAFRLVAQTTSGRITSEFPVTSVEGPLVGTRLAGDVGAQPDGRLDLSTTSGDITLALRP